VAAWVAEAKAKQRPVKEYAANRSGPGYGAHNLRFTFQLWMTTAIAAGAFMVAGCDANNGGSHQELMGATDQTVDQIRVWLARVADFEIAGIDCPPEVPLRRGYSFDCTVMAAGGGSAVVRVQLVNRNGQQKMRLKHGIVIAKEVEAAIAAKHGGKVDCGSPRVRAAKVGDRFACKRADASVIEVEVKDAKGNVAITRTRR
jgi:hypothetical protein